MPRRQLPDFNETPWYDEFTAAFNSVTDELDQVVVSLEEVRAIVIPTDPGGGQSSDLTATTGDATVTVNWTPALNATGYTIEIDPLSTGAGATSATKTASQLTHTFTGLTNGSQYLVTLTIGPSGVQRSLTATPAAPASNLLVGKVFTATVSDSTIEAGNPIANMTDGNLNTRWISQPTSPVSATIDLGAVYTLSRVVIVFAGNTIKNYTVSTSTNNSTYTVVETGITNNTEKQTVTIDNFDAEPKGRWLRITGVDRWVASFGNSIWEVSAYGTIDSSFPVGTVSNFTATVISGTQVNLAWAYTGSALANFTVRRNGLTVATLAANATSYSDTGLTAGGTYAYEVFGTFTASGATNTVALTRTTTSSNPTPTTGALGTFIFVAEATFDADLARTVESGNTWVRLDIPDGSYGSTNSSTLAFTRNAARAAFYKQACQKTKDAGLKIQLDMAAFPNNSGWTDAQFATATANQVRAVSEDIGQHVDLWQFFNEHDGRDFRSHAPGVASPAYWARLRDCMAVLRTAARQHSQAPVTTTTFGYPVDQNRYNIWQGFWDIVSPSCDIIGIHAYPADSQTNINNLATYMNNLRNRYSKPICILEFGVPDVAGYGSSTNVGFWIVQQIKGVMSVKPFCAILYHLRDRGLNNSTRTVSGELVFGIYNNNGTKKSYWQAVTDEVVKWKNPV